MGELLRDSDPDVRQAAARALGELGEYAQDQAPRLGELLRDPVSYVRWAAAEALGELGAAAQNQAPWIVELLRDSNPYESQIAAEALGKLGKYAQDQVPRLGELLRDSDPDVRWAAAETLGKLSEYAQDQAPYLGELLRDPYRYVRWAAAEALGKLRAAQEQAPYLGELLRDPDWRVREAAAEALRRLGAAAKNQTPRLGELLRDPYRYVRRVAAEALGEIGEYAQDQAPRLGELLRDPDKDVRQAAAKALGEIGEYAKDQAPHLGELLRDPNKDIRRTAAEALGKIGKYAQEQAPRLGKLLHDPDSDVRRVAATALIAVGPLPMESIPDVLSVSYEDSSRVGKARFLAHFLGAGNSEIEILIAWLGEPVKRPLAALAENHDQAVKTLNVFQQAWPASEPFPKLRRDLEAQIATVAQTGRWKTDDLALLKTHATNLEAVGSTHAAAVRQVIASVEATDHALAIAKVALGHVLFWLVLIALYPRSRIVQAIFFWNPWVRRFTGLGYVGFALTWVPFLRAKLFAPFKPSLIADAALDTFDEAAYFPDSAVREKTSGRQQPLREAIPAIRGQIVLEGESGIGKTMFLRLLVKRARRVVVYLPAKKCVGGVLEAIQAKLHGPTQDPAFLRNLIYSGALDICIDGLNEVSADARAKITAFVESYFKGNILMSTQPLEWTPPATAKIYLLEPLTENQIETFLLTRKDSLPADARLAGDAYEQVCRRYLTATLNPQQPPETLVAMRQLLSNPMDLTLVATMLACGEPPDLFRLQRQQYDIMAKDYQRTQLHEFPLRKFAEAVYQMRLQDEDALPVGQFTDELQCLERHKMTVGRQVVEGGKSRDEWHFRHDKITDFFIVQAFLGPDNDKPEKHLGDARFRGVYLQLARLLPLEDARALERRLIDYAADTQDHTVSDTFIQLLRPRQGEDMPN